MNDVLDIPSCAKVNLTLDVVGTRESDGYHFVDLVMVPLALHDTVTVRHADTISVTCTPDVAGPLEQNIAFKAAVLLKQTASYVGGAAIHIQKVIPVAGGMAGGSTNAAAVLTGLNQLWGLGLTRETLIDLAIQLGSDVPFFVRSRAARVQGVGEVLTDLAAPRPIPLVVATPDVAKSTGNVFRWFDELGRVERPDTQGMVAALASGDLGAIAQHLGNVFEPVMLPRYPEIVRLKETMLAGGALGALMSGAGPTVFGIVPDDATGLRLVETLRPHTKHIFFTHTLL